MRSPAARGGRIRFPLRLRHSPVPAIRRVAASRRFLFPHYAIEAYKSHSLKFRADDNPREHDSRRIPPRRPRIDRLDRGSAQPRIPGRLPRARRFAARRVDRCIAGTPHRRQPEAFASIRADLDRLIVPASSHFQHPAFFGYFPSNSLLSSVLGDYVSTGLAQLGLNWASSPALTELEEVTTDWLRQMLGLTEEWKGVIQDTASSASLVALLCARERTSRYSAARGGLAGRTGAIGRLLSEACAQLDREGRAARWIRPRQPEIDRNGRRACPATR